MVPFDAVVVPVLVDEAVLVAVAVGREEPVGAPVGDRSALCVARRVPSGEALWAEVDDGDADAESAGEVDALPHSCADAVGKCENEGLPVAAPMVCDARGDAVPAGREALAQPLLEGSAAVALTVALALLLADSHWVYVRVPVTADDAVRAAGVTVRVPLPPASDAVAHAEAVRPTLRVRGGEREVEIDAEGDLLAEVEPQGDAEAATLPLALGERLTEGLTEGDRERQKSAPSRSDTFPAEFTLHILGTAWGQYAYTKPAQSAREKSAAS